MKKIVFCVLQFTYGIIQNIVGLVVFIWYRKERHEKFFEGIVTFVDADNLSWGGISLGCFIFINAKREVNTINKTIVHEYGHTIQSALLGPLYFLVIGLPSFIWCNSSRFKKMRQDKNISYFSKFPENWANKLGERYTGLEAPQ